MAYDPQTHQFAMFGGESCTNPDLCYPTSDTWLWTGSTWTEVTPTVSPPARAEANMAWDPKSDQLILFGGGGGETGTETALSDTWEWTGHTWKQLSPRVSPPARDAAMMAWDGTMDDLILFGGSSNRGVDLRGTWAWTGATWQKLFPTLSPPAQDSGTMSWDAASKQLLLFCGNRLPESWIFSGTTWQELSPVTTPTPRDRAGMTYDSATQRIVLFGGYYGVGFTSFLGDTWAWNGSNWIALSPSVSPSVRADISMGWDSATQRIVLFGGYGSSLNDLSDTWTYGK